MLRETGGTYLRDRREYIIFVNKRREVLQNATQYEINYDTDSEQRDVLRKRDGVKLSNEASDAGGSHQQQLQVAPVIIFVDASVGQSLKQSNN
jgi:hypothetical protein